MKLKISTLEARFASRLPGGERIFVKAFYSDRPELRAHRRACAEREKVCLEALAGLAVPSLVPLSAAAARRLARAPVSSWLAQRRGSGATLDRAGLSPGEVVAVWLFLTEQLAAFRRHQILYTDLTSRNILVSRRPLGAVLVDFERAVARTRSERISWLYPFRPGIEAPERFRGAPHTERSLVYQHAMVLAHRLAGLNNAALAGAAGASRRLAALLRRHGGRALEETVRACLQARPSRRPSDYEELLSRLSGGGLSESAAAGWRRLRRPYAARLAEVGL